MFNNMMLAQLMKDLQVGFFWVGIAFFWIKRAGERFRNDGKSQRQQQKTGSVPHRESSSVVILNPEVG